jgi:hypothetical protein
VDVGKVQVVVVVVEMVGVGVEVVVVGVVVMGVVMVAVMVGEVHGVRAILIGVKGLLKGMIVKIGCMTRV